MQGLAADECDAAAPAIYLCENEAPLAQFDFNLLRSFLMPPATDRLDEWFECAYRELKGFARWHMAGDRKDHTLTPTAVMHEAYLTLRGTLRSHTKTERFYHASFRITIRRILIDYARYKNCIKRRGTSDLSQDCREIADPSTANALARDDLESMLESLSKSQPRAAAVARIRLNTDLCLQTIADRLGVSHRTVSSDWKTAVSFAREWHEFAN